MAVAAGSAGSGLNIGGTTTGGKDWNVNIQGLENLKGMFGGQGDGNGQDDNNPGNKSGSGQNNEGSQGNWMNDAAKLTSNTWTNYIEATQAPQQQALPQKTPQANQAPAQQPAVDNKPTIMKYIEASNRAAELKKQQEANNVDLSRYAE